MCFVSYKEGSPMLVALSCMDLAIKSCFVKAVCMYVCIYLMAMVSKG